MSSHREPSDIAVIEHRSAKVYDAGGQILISGPVEYDVREALDILVREDGAEVVSHPTMLGSAWLAACSHPLRKPVACKVSQEGFTIFVTGPTEQAVTVAMLEMTERGAHIVEPPRIVSGEWVAVLDGAQLGQIEQLHWSNAQYQR